MCSIARALDVRLDDDLIEACARRSKRVAMREDARRLAVDPEDRAELAVLRDELDEITPPWPAD
jgi:hypothetical protein